MGGHKVLLGVWWAGRCIRVWWHARGLTAWHLHCTPCVQGEAKPGSEGSKEYTARKQVCGPAAAGCLCRQDV